jgi:hypothetical protein
MHLAKISRRYEYCGVSGLGRRGYPRNCILMSTCSAHSLSATGCAPAVGSHRGGLSLEEQEESSIRDAKAGTTVLKVIRGTLQVQIAAAINPLMVNCCFAQASYANTSGLRDQFTMLPSSLT